MYHHYAVIMMMHLHFKDCTYIFLQKCTKNVSAMDLPHCAKAQSYVSALFYKKMCRCKALD